MRRLGLALLLGLAACGSSSSTTKYKNTTAKAQQPPPPVLYDPREGPGTTYESAKPGIFDAPGSSGDIEGMPNPGY